jgi:hypothetical protein
MHQRVLPADQFKGGRVMLLQKELCVPFEQRVQLFLAEFIKEAEEDGMAIWEDRLYKKAYEAALDELEVIRESYGD